MAAKEQLKKFKGLQCFYYLIIIVSLFALHYYHYNSILSQKESDRIDSSFSDYFGFLGYTLIGYTFIFAVLYVLAQHKRARLIKEKGKRIDELENELKDIRQTETTLREQLRKQKVILLCTSRLSEIEFDEHEQAQSAFLSSDIYKMFKEQAYSSGRITITVNDWRLLEIAINEVYKDFSENLRKIHEFSEQEFHICLLIKSNISPIGIAKLTNRTKASISVTRKRLYEKIFSEKGNPQKLDEFILSI